MKYIIDKATNRVIYQVPDGGRYFIDENSYLVEAEEFKFVQPSYQYRWRKVHKDFEFFPGKKVATVQDLTNIIPTPTKAPGPDGKQQMVITSEIVDKASFGAFLYEEKLKANS